MQISIVSDLHLGDPMCALYPETPKKFAPKLKAFEKAVGTGNDYLILLGDIFDFSIRSYAEVYAEGKKFFSHVQEKQLAKEILYVPGNHDFSFWHWLEHDLNIVKPIQNGEDPRPFRRSVPGFFDLRKAPKYSELELVGPDKPYGDIFLKHLAPQDLKICVAYPNVYLYTGQETLLLTHGHYLEAFWGVVSEYGPKIFGGDMAGDELNLKELVGVNFPNNQLASSGVGQAEPLTALIRTLQRNIKDGDLNALERYVNNLADKVVDPLITGNVLKEWITDKIINILKDKLLNFIREQKTARVKNETECGDSPFMSEQGTKDRLETYYKASQWEIEDVGEQLGIKLSPPRRCIIGHTHDPIPWGAMDQKNKYRLAGNPVVLFNTGGWLYRKDGSFCGAQVFKWDGTQMSSVGV
ncbi:MAG: metallophosphoesterase family protein [Desulfatibacillum sp.]|nr:metallophosphoesterase family protein [Desulfatibacillum sp.]